MQAGDLLYCRSTGLVGSLIRFGQDIRYKGWKRAIGHAIGRREYQPDDLCWGNHIAVVSNGSIIEAGAKGLVRSPVTKYGVTNSIILPLADVCPAASVVQRQAVVDFAERELAAKDGYSWLGIASIILQLLTPTKLDIAWDGTMICSAFGARAWEHAGVTVPTLSAYTTMPADLRAMVKP